MKSTRQHHLPRFILRGFGSRVRKGRSYTWVHRKALPAYEANIVNVGVEAGFYDLEGDTSVDRRITQSEGDFSELLQELIATDGRCQQQTQRISQFIHHLAVRPKSLRDGLSDIGQEMVNIVDAVFSDSNRLEKRLLESLAADREKHAADIEAHIREQTTGHSDVQVRNLTNLMLSLAPAYLRQNKEAMARLFSDLVPLLRESCRSASRPATFKRSPRIMKVP